MRSSSSTRRAGRAGFIAGLALVALAVSAWRVPGGERTLGLDATLRAGATGELGVAPVGVVAHASVLRPGGPALAGRVSIRNQTGVPLRVSLRLVPSIRDTDSSLLAELRADGRTLARGPLSALRRSAGSLRMRRGEVRALDVRAWLPASAAAGWRGRIVDLTVSVSADR